MRGVGPYEVHGTELPYWAALYLMHRSLDAINDCIPVGPQNKNTSTILHLAILRGEPVEEIENLIFLGARLTARNSDGDTPLDVAEFMSGKSQEGRAKRTWHLVSKYTHRQRRCYRSTVAFYGSIRRQGICKDLRKLMVRMLWETRYSSAWS